MQKVEMESRNLQSSATGGEHHQPRKPGLPDSLSPSFSSHEANRLNPAYARPATSLASHGLPHLPTYAAARWEEQGEGRWRIFAHPFEGVCVTDSLQTCHGGVLTMGKSGRVDTIDRRRTERCSTLGFASGVRGCPHIQSSGDMSND